MNRFFLPFVLLSVLLLVPQIGVLAQQNPAGGNNGTTNTGTGNGGANNNGGTTGGSTASGLQSESKILLYDGVSQGLGKLVGKMKLSLDAGHSRKPLAFMVTLPSFSADDVASCWELKRQLRLLDQQLDALIQARDDLVKLSNFDSLKFGGATGSTTASSSSTAANPSIKELSGLGADFTQFGMIASATSALLQLANTAHSTYTVSQGDLGLDQPTVNSILINQLAKRHLSVYDYTQAYLTEEDYLGDSQAASSSPLDDVKGVIVGNPGTVAAPSAGATPPPVSEAPTLLDLVAKLHGDIVTLNDWQATVTNRNTTVTTLISTALAGVSDDKKADYTYLEGLLNLPAVLAASANVDQALEGPIAYKTSIAQPLASNPNAGADTTTNQGHEGAPSPNDNGAAAAAFKNGIQNPAPPPAASTNSIGQPSLPATSASPTNDVMQPAVPAPLLTPTAPAPAKPAAGSKKDSSGTGSITLVMPDGSTLSVPLTVAAPAPNTNSTSTLTNNNNNASPSVPLTSPINVIEKYRVIEAWAKRMAATHTYLISARVLLSNATQAHVSRFILEDYVALSSRNVLQVQVFDIFKARYRYSDDFEDYRQYVYFPSRVRDGAENKWKNEDTLTNDRTDSHESLQWMSSLTAAEAIAKEQCKDILMESVSSTSDYGKNTLEIALSNSNELRTFAAEHLVLLRIRPIDFRKQIPAVQVSSVGPDSLQSYQNCLVTIPKWSLIDSTGEIRLHGDTVEDSSDLLDELQEAVTP